MIAVDEKCIDRLRRPNGRNSSGLADPPAHPRINTAVFHLLPKDFERALSGRHAQPRWPAQMRVDAIEMPVATSSNTSRKEYCRCSLESSDFDDHTPSG